MQERRTTIRVNRLSRAQYCPSGDLVPRDGRIINLSERGAGLLTQDIRPVGERLTISVSLPGEDEPLTATGVVRWSDPQPRQGRWHALGVEWLPLEETARHRLHALLDTSTQTVAPSIPTALRGRWRTIIRSAAFRASVVLGLVAIAFLVRWGTSLQRQNRQLAGAIQQRNLMIAQLEQQGSRLEQELTASQRQVVAAAAALSQLGDQTQVLEGDVQRLSQEVERFQQSYVQIREERDRLTQERTRLTEERTQLIQQVLDLEQERMLLSQRLESIPGLRLAIREAIEARKQLERRARLQARQAKVIDQAADGNRGYLIWQGQPTGGRSIARIKVHEPEASPTPP